MTISSNLTVLNLPHFAQSLLSQTLQLSIFPTSLISSVLSQNPSNSTSLATETTEISTKNCINTIGKDLVNLLGPRYLEVWGNLHLAVVFQLTLTTTTVDLEPSMKAWQNNASSNMTSIQKKLTTAKLILNENQRAY